MKTTTQTVQATQAMTPAQSERCRARNGAGKFVKNPCECCSKGAPMNDYFSDVRHIDGETFQFITLCNRCATKLTALEDVDFAAFVTMHHAITTW